MIKNNDDNTITIYTSNCASTSHVKKKIILEAANVASDDNWLSTRQNIHTNPRLTLLHASRPRSV
jgi:hypothetical protein